MSHSMPELEAERKLTFGKLLTVSDEISKTVLTVFDYRPSVKRVVNVKKMTSSKFTLAVLETCATFLNIPVQDENDVALYSNKEPLATRIVAGIEALFPSHCAACKTDYSTEFNKDDEDDEVVTLSCYRCFQESHTCEKQNEALKMLKELAKTSPLPAGMVWLCHECTVELNPITPPKRKIVNTAGGTQSVPGTPSNGRTDEQEQDDENKVASDKSILDQSELSKALGEAADERFRQESKQTQRHSYNTVTSTKVCPKYLTRNCPHGRSGTIQVDGAMCEFVHPKLCRRYCEDGNDRRYGCTRRRCLYYHPKLCWNSTEKRYCPEEGCPFTHLRGTIRDPTQRERARPRDERNGYNNRRDNAAAAPPRNSQQTAHSRHDGPVRRRRDTHTEESGEDRGDRQKDNLTERCTAPQPVTHKAAQENQGMSHADFLQLMGLVTSMQVEFKKVATTQDEFRKEMTNIKLNLNNVSLATQHPTAEHIKISSQYMPTPPPMLNMTGYPMLSSQPGPGYQQHCY